jgi:hypothetical protein
MLLIDSIYMIPKRATGGQWIILDCSDGGGATTGELSFFAYTALPFSMLPDRIDQNILLSGENVAALVLGLFYCVICILNTMCFML